MKATDWESAIPPDHYDIYRKAFESLDHFKDNIYRQGYFIETLERKINSDNIESRLHDKRMEIRGDPNKALEYAGNIILSSKQLANTQRVW